MDMVKNFLDRGKNSPPFKKLIRKRHILGILVSKWLYQEWLISHFFILNIKHFEPCIHVLPVTVKLFYKIFFKIFFFFCVSLEGWIEYYFDCTLMWSV